MIVDIQLGLLAVFAALLAVLASQVLKLFTALRYLHQDLAAVKSRLEHASPSMNPLQPVTGGSGAPDPRPGTEPPGPTPPSLPSAEPATEATQEAAAAEAADETRTEQPAQAQGSVRSGGSFQNNAQELYRRWCLEDRRPAATDRIDIGLLRYAGDERNSDLSASIHVFRDDPQTGEFVRFWATGTEKGLAFPNPEAFFNEVVHRILFPGLTADTFGNHRQLANTSPVRIHRQADGSWQKAP